MLQVAVIRQNPESVKERLDIRNFKELELVDTIIQLDDQRKKLQLESDTTQSKINAFSKDIGQRTKADEQRPLATLNLNTRLKL